jgi:hypothetical protein
VCEYKGSLCQYEVGGRGVSVLAWGGVWQYFVYARQCNSPVNVRGLIDMETI